MQFSNNPDPQSTESTDREGWPIGSPPPLIHKDASANPGDLEWGVESNKIRLLLYA